MEYVDSNWSQMYAVWSRFAMKLSLARLATVLNRDKHGVSSCILPKTGGRQLLTGPGARTQTGHSDFKVGDGELPGYFFFFTVEVSAQLPVPPRLHLYMPYKSAREELLREPCVMEKATISAPSVFVGHG